MPDKVLADAMEREKMALSVRSGVERMAGCYASVSVAGIGNWGEREK